MTHSCRSCLSFDDDKCFLTFAGEIPNEKCFIYLALNNLHTIKKSSTRKEMLFRLLKGKDYIDMNYLTNPEISKIACHCHLSVFHFFRSFKQAFQITPYHYIMQKKLDHALSLIALDKYSLSEIAVLCGFSDIFTFSKAFKRRFHYPPSRYTGIRVA